MLGEGEDEFAEALRAFRALKAGSEVPDGAPKDVAAAEEIASAVLGVKPIDATDSSTQPENRKKLTKS
ncbi:MAG: hypothetical protein U1A77_07255 [Pirellulales bacterium]